MIGHARDTINMIDKLSFRKLLNIILVYLSYFYSRWSKNPLHPASPISLSIEPTTSCNLRCPECPSGLRSFSRPTGMLDKNFFKEVLDQVHERVFYLVFYFQGEPFLNPEFLDMISYASKKNLYTATSTNAHYFNDETARKTIESGIDRLIISIDGTSQETYEQYRIGGTLNKVLEGTKKLVEWKKKLKSSTPFLVFQFLVVRPNEHQVEEVKKLAKEIGVDKVVFKTAQIYDFKNGSDLIPLNDKYSRYRKLSDGTYEIKNSLKNQCWKMWHSSVITWDGQVVPCCFDKDAKHKMGSLKEKTFKEIWNDKAYHKFRASLMKSRKEIDICKNCSEGTKVWAD
ncbi:MAG TPA: SPASM domain-containing protein [Bacteroidia bacterium]|nr:SPASM domain-containing protein [Bacteroidia bacterium]